MSDIRAIIREILAEEIAALRTGQDFGRQQETVSVASSQDLTAFALSVLSRASDPAFAAAIRDGSLSFVPLEASPPPRSIAMPSSVLKPQAALVTTVPPAIAEIGKSLITERDIASIADGASRIRIGKKSRMTPLAIDEARRRGIRVERSGT